MQPPLIGIPIEFFLFGATLTGVAVFHTRALWVSLAGLGTIIYKVAFTGLRKETD